MLEPGFEIFPCGTKELLQSWTIGLEKLGSIPDSGVRIMEVFARGPAYSTFRTFGERTDGIRVCPHISFLGLHPPGGFFRINHDIGVEEGYFLRSADRHRAEYQMIQPIRWLPKIPISRQRAS